MQPTRHTSGHVVEYQTCDHEVAGLNPTHDYCVQTPTQSVIPLGSVNEYQ